MPVFAGTELTCLRGDRLVFTGLDFQVAPGDALVLLGPNGSGKSSLLRVMAGLLRPVAGLLSWDGVPVAEEPDGHRARVRYVGHLDAVKPVLTAAENLAFWAAIGGAADPQANALAALDRLGVPHIAGVPGRYLSAGQKRRLNLARLLAAPADLWLLDEPTVALDRAAIALFEGLVAEHRAGGGMVVLSTHTDIAAPGGRELHLDDFTPVYDDESGEAA
ncbi:heme ABC exporter ATP-binding protein CcmA [Azospirillum thermophilum]|uniref:Heme ABC transporter ATP-binding protein CcmA n=1 Tax=Azospirillum thermophilum TaxID=2202148 RepID=A0A2S2CTU5_9PROT|nr:heme ABC exporter ATP-binding protein CcmA [Azospirillum thermophilum]AWK87790.1 heme ABC transporter ATP-binding protein CcmA [Azospirillum thermophilum]